MKNRAALLLLVGLSLILGCGQTSLVSKPPVTIVISPSFAAMLAYNSVTFTAKGFDSGGNEVPFVPSSWSPYPWDLGRITETGVKDGKPFCVFESTAYSTGEIRCVYNDAVGFVTLESVTTVERVAIKPNNYPSPVIVIMGVNKTFTSKAWASGGQELTLFTPAWQVNGGIGNITSEGMAALFQPTSTGPGSIEAILSGVTGEVIISVEASP